MNSNQKTSLLIPSQLPEFVRDNTDYENFSLFLQAYYEWMEENGNVTEASKNLLSYRDIDTTLDKFIDYFTNDFLPYFPKDSLISKNQAVKIARQLYQTKGTLASYKFLFKVLYNSDFDVFFTKEAVLRASAGTWYVAKSLRLNTSDKRWTERNTNGSLIIQYYRLFGETTKSIATIETSVVSGSKTEVFVADIERLFQSGEFVRVVDSNNQTVLFDGQPLRAKIVGQISSIKVDPKNRGLLYQPGDPIIVYGGLSSNTGIGATAEVNETTAGSIQRINVINGGYGYTLSNTVINITNAPGANAIVGSVNPAANGIANVSLIPTNVIQLGQYTTIGNTNYSFFSSNPTANANTKLSDAFTFTSFTTYPISSILVKNGGGGITQIPQVTAVSYFPTDIDDISGSLSNLGILAPIQILNGGHGYQANDVIVFTGGAGIGAYANVATVDGSGSITSVEYVSGDNLYPLGGMGYDLLNLPSVTVSSANVQAANASLFVPGILGQGATFSVVVDRAGSITTIRLINPGEDYIETPKVSAKVQDILVSNLLLTNVPLKGDVIYQGVDIDNATYIAAVDSFKQLTTDFDPTLSKFNLRVFNFNSNPDPTQPLKIDRGISLNVIADTFDGKYNVNGYKNYGDGNARANAIFLNGLTVSQGQYLTSQGQPSSFDVLQSEDYNNFTYKITVEKEIEKYRDVLLNLLHPTGTKILGRYALKSNNAYNFQGQTGLASGKPLNAYTGFPGSSVTMTTDFNTKSTNIVQFNDLVGANIGGFVFANSTIQINPVNGPEIVSQIESIDTVSNVVTLKTNTWLTFANVAYAGGYSGSNVINILSLTGAYDIINYGNYSNTDYPLKDIVYAGDTVLLGNNSPKIVSYVDYTTGNGIIYLTSNLTDSFPATLLSVNRTLTAQTDVKIFVPIGIQYFPEITTEDGQTITTEDDRIILLG